MKDVMDKFMTKQLKLMSGSGTEDDNPLELRKLPLTGIIDSPNFESVNIGYLKTLSSD